MTTYVLHPGYSNISQRPNIDSIQLFLLSVMGKLKDGFLCVYLMVSVPILSRLIIIHVGYCLYFSLFRADGVFALINKCSSEK